MTERVRIEHLDRCRTPESARCVLGQPLARYLLRPEKRQAAGLQPPHLPVGRGALTALLVLERPRTQERASDDPWPCLAAGFGLPLVWRQERADSARLPRGLIGVAGEVRRVLGYEGWGLDLSEELAGYDLSALEFEVPSLWAPLAAALELAVNGGQPDPRVFASGRWTDRGMASVGGIEIKLAVARDLAQGGEATVFLPAQSYEQAREWAGAGVDIVAYDVSETDPKKAMAAHLARLDVPPQRGASPIEDRLAYANRRHIVLDRDNRQPYYIEQLVADLAQRVAERAAGDGLIPDAGLDRLILVLSLSHELCRLMLLALRPRHALVLYTKDTERFRDGIENSAAAIGEDGNGRSSAGTRLDFLDTSAVEEERCLRDCERWLTAASDHAARAVDVTGGNKIMSLLLSTVARATGTRVLYLEHDYRYGKPQYGTERIRSLDWVGAGVDC